MANFSLLLGARLRADGPQTFSRWNVQYFTGLQDGWLLQYLAGWHRLSTMECLRQASGLTSD